MTQTFHSGFVAIIGRPNVGKSTLINQLMGEKLSIISNKPQTTRNKIQFIYSDDRMQVIFLDTPGVQKPRNELGEAMLTMSKKSLEDVDLCLFVTDTSGKPGPFELTIIDFFKDFKDLPVLLLINKIDEVDQNRKKELLTYHSSLGNYAKVLAISAKTGENIDELKEAIYQYLPKGPCYYPTDMITDRSERFIISEIIREKCLQDMNEEIPHGIFVEILTMSYRKDQPICDIQANIIVEKDSHKGMVIGKGGKKLRSIGTKARKDIEKFIDSKVNLKLWVKVEKDWRKKQNKLREFGYE